MSNPQQFRILHVSLLEPRVLKNAMMTPQWGRPWIVGVLFLSRVFQSVKLADSNPILYISNESTRFLWGQRVEYIVH